jgi:Co/Zn/Cd efflux system component
MATHVLWQADVADFDAWLTVFREDQPMRKAAGIHDLHIWRDPDQRDHAIAMFEVRDLDKARAFLDSQELAMHHERGGVAHIQVKLLQPV